MTSHSAATSESGFSGALGSGTGTTMTDEGHQSTADAGAMATMNTTTDSNMLRASFTSTTEGLVLYDLTNTCEGPRFREFSPHCVKTLMALRLLSIGFERQRMTFNDIRTRLTRIIGDEHVTVPTLELADGRHLTDSWTIAVYLSGHHPHGVRLFPNGHVSRALAASLNNFCKTVLAPHLGPLARPAVFECLTDQASKTYFERTKVGKQKLDACRAMNADQRQAHIDACASSLEVIQAALAAVQESHIASDSVPSSNTLYLEGGPSPSHADFVVYGWYAYTRVAGTSVTRAIWHSFPLVSRWIDDLNKFAGPEITDDFC